MTTGVICKAGYGITGLGRFAQGIASSLVCEFTSDTTTWYDNVFLAGFSINEVIKIVGSRSPNKVFYVYCSNFGQAELSTHDEPSAEMELLFNLVKIKRQYPFFDVVTSSKPLAAYFGFIFVPPVRVFDESMSLLPQINMDRKNYSIIGNNFRKHVNFANMVAAASRLNPKEKIYAREPVYCNKFYGELFNCEFYSNQLKNDKEYFDEVSTHRLGLQVHFSASFSYNALELAMVGVPMICSKTIYWYPEKYIIENPDNWEEIYQVSQYTLDHFNLESAKSLREFAFSVNNRNREATIGVLKNVC